MDKRTFKTSVLKILEEDVEGLSTESKLKYLKKWIRDFEQQNLVKTIQTINDQVQVEFKIGALVRSMMSKLASGDLLSPEKIRLLQDERYCKSTFDINYPFLKKVESGSSHSLQRKINGYDRYWSDEILIHRERYFICNDWYERNRSRFTKWVKDIEVKS
jgi:hypothetical protein